MYLNRRRAIFSLVAMVLALCPAGPLALAAGPANLPSGQVAAWRVVPANDPRFFYEGRIDFSSAASPVVVWAGSRISLDFDGALLALRFGAATGQNFFNVQVDGINEVVAVRAGGAQRIEVPVPPQPGRHRLVVFKRSEAAKGHVRFEGIELAAGAQVWASEPPKYQVRFEFFGDSITVGACNEDGATDQWVDFGTHNHALSYDYLTSLALHADHRAMAVSGMGVATGWTNVTAGQVWDRLYPVADAPRANLQTWQPDVAFVNLGENDDSFPRAHGQPFPPGFTAGYVALVKSIRAAYPRTQIVLLRGGMYGGKNSEPLREAWAAAVKELEAGDPAVSDYVFTHWSSNHPRVADDHVLADELVAWLKVQPFMRRFL